MGRRGLDAMTAPFSASDKPDAPEQHYVTRSGWLRAAVLGANDGLLSVASLMVGVFGASFEHSHLILTGGGWNCRRSHVYGSGRVCFSLQPSRQ